MRILGLWSGHDASFCVLKDGIVEMHTELERHLRIKEPVGNSAEMFNDHYPGTLNDIDIIATAYPLMKEVAALESHGKPIYVVGHHQSHAAHAYYSSQFDDSVVITLDGGGVEKDNGISIGGGIWKGIGTKLEQIRLYPLHQVNVGGVWSRVTRHVFRFENGHPFGNQCGSTMALAALAKEPQKYVQRFKEMFKSKLQEATMYAPGHTRGTSARSLEVMSQRHPYLADLSDIADGDDQEKYNMAAALQTVTEEFLENLLLTALQLHKTKNVCWSGGVALNSVAMGKLAEKYKDLNFYVPPVPYDAGLTIGAAQYVYHHVCDKSRIDRIIEGDASPYLGPSYSLQQVEHAILNKNVTEFKEKTDDSHVIELLMSGKIISIFNGKAESGRRALGNRSILADPRRSEMKDKVNEKVKHRQWFRPFAPSILEEHVGNWFYSDLKSPYMGLCLKIKEERRALIPAVCHFDGTARLQTVTSKINPWYHNFLTKWNEKTQVPILLNTSFNDREPICERPEHAIECFMNTEIDALYFPEHGMMLRKK
jgi:carbamoyltransferase